MDALYERAGADRPILGTFTRSVVLFHDITMSFGWLDTRQSRLSRVGAPRARTLRPLDSVTLTTAVSRRDPCVIIMLQQLATNVGCQGGKLGHSVAREESLHLHIAQCSLGSRLELSKGSQVIGINRTSGDPSLLQNQLYQE